MISNNIFQAFPPGGTPLIESSGPKRKKKSLWNSRLSETVDFLSPLAAMELLECLGLGTLSWHTPGRTPAFTQSYGYIWGKGPSEATLLCLNGKVCWLQILTQVVMSSGWATPLVSLLLTRLEGKCFCVLFCFFWQVWLTHYTSAVEYS